MKKYCPPSIQIIRFETTDVLNGSDDPFISPIIPFSLPKITLDETK